MLKRLISPLQRILLQKGICPHCTVGLKKAPIRTAQTQKIDKIVCSCGHEYIHDKEVNMFSEPQTVEEQA